MDPRFLKYISFSNNCCWIWTGSKNRNGYGNFSILQATGKYKTCRAHKYSYESLIGPVPNGTELDHFVCSNRACVNPFHLKPVTHRENVLRGRGICALNSRKTYCKRGHPFTKENTLYKKNRIGRICKTCNRNQSRAWREARADLVPLLQQSIQQAEAK